MGVTLLLCGAAIKYVMDSIIIRKMREIGSLKAFGARDRVIFKIFLYQGVFIGFISGFLGIFLAILVMNIVNWYGMSMKFIAGTQLRIGFVVNWFTVVIAVVLPVVLLAWNTFMLLPDDYSLRSGRCSPLLLPHR